MTDRELERRANRRLAVLRHVEEVSGNVAATCRYYGISRQCYYGWLRRYEADGLDGLSLINFWNGFAAFLVPKLCLMAIASERGQTRTCTRHCGNDPDLSGTQRVQGSDSVPRLGWQGTPSQTPWWH